MCPVLTGIPTIPLTPDGPGVPASPCQGTQKGMVGVFKNEL